MRWVQQPAIRPHKCAVFPSIGSHNAHGPFLDTGQDMRDPDSHVYISTEAIRQMAALIGWQPASATQALEQKVRELERTCTDLMGQVEDAAKFRDAAEYTLGAFDTKVRHKPGRKAAA